MENWENILYTPKFTEINSSTRQTIHKMNFIKLTSEYVQPHQAIKQTKINELFLAYQTFKKK